VGKVTNYFSKIGVAEIKMEADQLKVGDNIYIMGSTTGVYEDTVREIRVNLQPVESSVKGEDCSIAVKSLVRRADKVYRIEQTSK